MSTQATGNGVSRDASGRIEVRSPATGSLIAAVSIHSPEAVATTVARVRANQPEWEAIGIEGRYRWLGKLRYWLLDNSERVLDTMVQETGKVRPDASNEPTYLADPTAIGLPALVSGSARAKLHR